MTGQSKERAQAYLVTRSPRSGLEPHDKAAGPAKGRPATYLCEQSDKVIEQVFEHFLAAAR